MTADGVLWQPRLGWDMLIPLVPVTVGIIPAFVDVGWVRYVIIASVVVFLSLFAYFLRQKLIIGKQGPALLGLFGTRRSAWADIAHIEIRPHFDDSCYVTLRCTMRNGSRRRHILSYLAFEAVRELVGDLRTYAEPHGIQVSVTGSAVDRRTAGEPVDADT